jgi:hypothetical protein
MTLKVVMGVGCPERFMVPVSSVYTWDRSSDTLKSSTFVLQAKEKRWKIEKNVRMVSM